MDESRLLGSKKVAGAAQLQILERDLIAGTQLGVVLQNREATIRVLVDRVGHEQITACPAMGSTDAPPELIQLRQTERVGAVDKHRVGVGHVEPRFDDHRRNENVYL